MYAIIVEEECCSEKRNTVQELQPALKRIKKARNSIPTEIAPGVPVAVSDHCAGQRVSGERQIPIRDSVCDNIRDDCKQTQRSSISSYAEINDHTSSVKSNDGTYEPTNNNNIQMAQVPHESHYLKLQHHSLVSDEYTNLNQPKPTGDLGTGDPQAIYYINQLEIWNHANMLSNTQWMINFNGVIAAGTVLLGFFGVTASQNPTEVSLKSKEKRCAS